mgnify:CR=1 FL=1
MLFRLLPRWETRQLIAASSFILLVACAEKPTAADALPPMNERFQRAVRQALAEQRAQERGAPEAEACGATVEDEEIELELLRRRATERGAGA